MAVSNVDIVNMALAHLGDQANVTSISPSDGSAQADHAARIYGQTRDWLLERFAWKFALRREQLAERTDLSFGSWEHIYAEPNNCLRLLAILPVNYTSDDQTVFFQTETDSLDAGLVLTNAEGATARFIARVTNPARFTPGFTEALSWFLAAGLAGPIIKGETGRAESIRCWQVAAQQYGSATGLSANQAKRDLQHVPAFIAARGVGMDDYSRVIRSV